MATEDRTPREWGELLREQLQQWEHARERLTELMQALLDAAGIDAQIESRVKEPESFVGKLNRKPHSYRRPLEDMPDILGLRIITYYEEDIQAVAEVLRREFEIDEDQSDVKGALLAPDRFGYLSVHYVVALKENRAGLVEWQSFVDRKAEIQIRTVLQHAWAAIDHKLRYKREQDVPQGLAEACFA